MNISISSPISIKAAPARKLIPLSEYKGPILDLRFWEEDEIKLLKKQLLQLEQEAQDVIRTTDINKKLTGFQKNKCMYKLFFIQEAINDIKVQIYKIKKERFTKQKAEFAQKSI